MNGLERQRWERDALEASSKVPLTNRYGDAIDRYLRVMSYRESQFSPAHPEPQPAVRPVPRSAGVVVAGVDDSPASYVALDHAAIEAEMHGWDLRIVHVEPGGAARRPAWDRGARLLEQMTDRVHAYSRTVAVVSRLKVGSPAAVLLADAESAKLVVVGRRHGTPGAAFGLTVGDRVAGHHGGPVLVVRVPGWPPGPDLALRPIVVGVDDSPLSPKVIEFALSEARVRGCDVMLLHADGDSAAENDRLEKVGGVMVHHRIDGADPVAALVEASARAAAVVVGRDGHSGLTGALLGSVGRAVLQHAKCPVFVVS
jgi:nucleotide-binding universal stress UspA family protein